MMNPTKSMLARIATLAILCSAYQTPALAQQFQDQTASLFPPGLLEYTNQLTIGDIDNDGDLDIIFANGGDYSTAGAPQQLRIFINNGSATFTDESSTRAAGALFLCRGAELGDVDGDGDLDIIVAQDFARQPQLLINNGSGVFSNQTAARLPVMLLSSTRGQFADVDNDGDLDIYLVNGGASRFGTAKGVLWINNGLGFFTDETASRMPNETVIQPMDCIFGDIDGNFTLDLIIASRNTTASTTNGKTYKNNGLGVFTGVTSPSEKNNYSYDLGDMDGDGDLDLLGANAHPTSTNSELLGRNNGSGSFTSSTFPTNTIDDNDSKFFDYDNDGDMDLIIASLGTTERIYSNNGTGTFTLVNGLITAVSDSSLDVKVADLNNDGRLDVVTAQGESGSFTNRIYMNVSGRPDTQLPRIVKTEQVPDSLSSPGGWVVRTVVYDNMSSDRGFFDKGIKLNYSVGALTTNQVSMKWVGNSEWRGVIPAQPSGSVVTYFVTARDWSNNLATGPNMVFNVLYPPCPADTNGDHQVNVADLLGVINTWGNITHITHVVTVQDFTFSPAVVNAKSGDTIEWDWVGGVHTLTSGSACTGDGRFNQAFGSGSWFYGIPLDFKGAIPYFCTPHCSFGMTANINVADIPTDINNDGAINVTDLLAVINSCGACPQ